MPGADHFTRELRALGVDDLPPFGELQRDGRMRPASQLRDAFAPLAGERRRPVFSCGSGVTACILALGAELAGYDDLAVYDGSWSEWGLPRADRPVVTGPQSGGPQA